MSLSSPQAQDQSQTPYTIHHLAALGFGAKVQTETVPVHRRESRVLQLPHPHRDPGQDLVPEPTGQSQASTRGRAGKAQVDCQTCPAPQFQSASSSWDTTSFGGLALWPVVPLPEAFIACCSSGALWDTVRVQHVSPRMRRALKAGLADVPVDVQKDNVYNPQCRKNKQPQIAKDFIMCLAFKS